MQHSVARIRSEAEARSTTSTMRFGRTNVAITPSPGLRTRRSVGEWEQEAVTSLIAQVSVLKSYS